MKRVPLGLAVMAPELIRHFQRHLDRGAAVVGIEHPAAGPTGMVVKQQLGQLHGRGMRHAGEVDVIELLQGLPQGRHQRRDSDARAGSSTTMKCRR